MIGNSNFRAKCIALSIGTLFFTNAAYAEVTIAKKSITESIDAFDRDHVYARSARSVGKLTLLARRCYIDPAMGGCEEKPKTCTATIVGNGKLNYFSHRSLVITNEHCLIMKPPKNNHKYWTVAATHIDIQIPERVSLSEEDIEKLGASLSPDRKNIRLRVDPVPIDTSNCYLETVDLPQHGDCQDYAILRLAKAKYSDAYIEPAMIFTRRARSGERVFALQYPEGGPLVVSHSGNCTVRSDDGQVPTNRLSHRCATDEGSSGAIIFAESDGAMLGLHNSGWANDVDETKSASAAEFYDIFKQSRVVSYLQDHQSTGKIVSLLYGYNWIDSEKEYSNIAAQLHSRLCLVANNYFGDRIFPDLLHVIPFKEDDTINEEYAPDLALTREHMESTLSVRAGTLGLFIDGLLVESYYPSVFKDYDTSHLSVEELKSKAQLRASRAVDALVKAGFAADRIKVEVLPARGEFGELLTPIFSDRAVKVMLTYGGDYTASDLAKSCAE